MDFEDYLREKDLAERTVSGYAADLSLFAKWFNAHNDQPFSPTELTPTDVRDYRAWLLKCEQKPASINRQLAALRAWGEWGVATKQIEQNPTQAIHRVELGKHTPKWLDKKQQARLLREVERDVAQARTRPARFKSRRNIAIVTMLLHTGLRISELCDLKARAVTINDRSGKVAVIGKGRKYREVPLNAQVRTTLATWRSDVPDAEFLFQGESGPICTATVRVLLSKYGRRAQVPVNPHILRHTFAKNLVDAGVPLEHVAMLLGHSDLETTRIYTMPSQQDLQRAVERLDL